jgi:CelD/BcsL family acetyltransferase involved in cellulose biosynthesis
MLTTFHSATAEFANLRDDWNRLAAGDPFASWEWRFAWWQAFGAGRQLQLGVVRRSGRIVAIAPWFVGRKFLAGPTLEFLGSGKVCTDYQRILLDADLDDAERHEAVESLADGSLPGRLDLDGVVADEFSTVALTDALTRRGWSVTAEPLESCWIVGLPNDWTNFVADVPRATRRKIHKAGRRFSDPDVGFHQAATRDEIESVWSEFVRLHEFRFRNKVGGGCFGDPVFERFLRDAVCRLVERGAAKIVWCEYLGRAVSAQLYLLGHRTASMYQSGFDPGEAHLEPGHLLYSRVIQDLIHDGYENLDFLRGDESYKAGWNARSVPLSRLIAVAPGPLVRARHRVWTTARRWNRKLRQARAEGPAAAGLAKSGSAEPIVEKARGECEIVA